MAEWWEGPLGIFATDDPVRDLRIAEAEAHNSMDDYSGLWVQCPYCGNSMPAEDDSCGDSYCQSMADKDRLEEERAEEEAEAEAREVVTPLPFLEEPKWVPKKFEKEHPSFFSEIVKKLLSDKSR